jgi:putative hydrolase of the HAD superfamily
LMSQFPQRIENRIAAKPMPITTVIFDYGCVLSLAPQPEDYESLRQAIGVDAAALQDIYWRNRDAYDRDGLDAPAYWQKVALDAGVSFSAEKMETWAALDCQVWSRPNDIMVEWVRVFRARGLKTAILSNMSRCVGDCLRRKIKWLELFDHVCLSGELKMGKPDLEIYHACLAALGVPAPQTLFIDDREVNITAARATGMHGIVFRSVDQLQTDLEPYGLAESLAEAKARAR